MRSRTGSAGPSDQPARRRRARTTPGIGACRRDRRRASPRGGDLATRAHHFILTDVDGNVYRIEEHRSDPKSTMRLQLTRTCQGRTPIAAQQLQPGLQPRCRRWLVLFGAGRRQFDQPPRCRDRDGGRVVRPGPRRRGSAPPVSTTRSAATGRPRRVHAPDGNKWEWHVKEGRLEQRGDRARRSKHQAGAAAKVRLRLTDAPSGSVPSGRRARRGRSRTGTRAPTRAHGHVRRAGRGGHR
jgi:hypothetical protein